jgi:hypothetical protein
MRLALVLAALGALLAVLAALLAVLALTAGSAPAQAACDQTCIALNRDVLAKLARDHPLPKPKPKPKPLADLEPLFAALAGVPFVSKTVLQDEYGGKLQEHWDRFAALAGTDDEVEIRGTCQSACTLVTARVPKARLCFADNAHLDFHQARSIADNSVSPGATRWMVVQYPADIQAWLEAKGGVARMPATGFWVLPARELWDMGYRRCAD